MDDLLEPEIGKEARDTVGVVPVPDEVDVAVVSLAEVERPAVEAHGQAAQEAQDDALRASRVDDPLGVGDLLGAGREYQFDGYGRVHGP